MIIKLSLHCLILCLLSSIGFSGQGLLKGSRFSFLVCQSQSITTQSTSSSTSHKDDVNRFWNAQISTGSWQIMPATFLVMSFLVILIVMSILSMIVLSIERTKHGVVVFYKSNLDLFISFLPLILYLVVKMISIRSIAKTDYTHLWVYDSLILIAMIYNYGKVLKENIENPFLAFCVGSSRNIIGYLIPLIAILIYITIMTSVWGSQTHFEWLLEKTILVLILSAYIWLLHFLVCPEAQRSHDEVDEVEPTTPRQEEKHTDPSPMSPPDPNTPHAILGVTTDASPEQIKQQYRALSRLYHPDKVALLGIKQREEAHEKMKQINQAYEALKEK